MISISRIFTLFLVSSLLVVSCRKEGCTDQNASNYDPDAENDDGSCIYDSNGGGNSNNTENLAGNTSSPETIIDVISDNTSYDYYVDGTWEINAEVTIEPGVRILMRSGAEIEVEENGSLIAIGTSSNKIAFIGEQSVPGYWDVIRFDGSNNPNNELTHVEVKYAGGDDYYLRNAGVYVRGGARLKMNNTSIEDCDRYGLKVNDSEGYLAEFSDNFITGSGWNPIFLHNLGQLENFSGNNMIVTDNTYNTIRVDGGNVNDPVDVPQVNGPIHMEGTTDINAAVSIAAGNYIQMGSAAQIEVNSNGSLSMVGTSSEQITVTGAQEVKGYWNCIRFDDSNNPSNEMQYVNISYGGGDDYYLLDASVYIKASGYLTMGNSSVTYSERDGVKVEDPNGTFIDEGTNTFSNNDGQDVNLP